VNRIISTPSFQEFTAAVADARAEGLEVKVTSTSAPYEATAKDAEG
jgi:hypothetical protein